MAVFEFIEGWYNPRRRHSAIGYLSPMEYERNQLPPLALTLNRPRNRGNSTGPRFRALALLGRLQPPGTNSYALPGVRETCTASEVAYPFIRLLMAP